MVIARLCCKISLLMISAPRHQMRQLVVFACAATLIALPAAAVAQAGSTGATVSNRDKSISGGQEQTAPTRGLAPVRKPISLRAAAYTRSSGIEVGVVPAWGLTSIHNAPPYTPRRNMAEYDFTASAGGRYRIEVEYAAAESRPVVISLNGAVVNAAGLAEITGGWSDEFQRRSAQGDVTLKQGLNTLQFKRDNYFPHIRGIRFVPE
jgi:hypothetical protein